MKKIYYNKYIDLIGIEFEGFFSPKILKEISNMKKSFRMFLDIVNDGSLTYDDIVRPNSFIAQEIKTIPSRTSKDLNAVLAYMNNIFKKDYLINDSVGLHYHISLKDTGFGALCSEDFYNDYVKIVKAYFPKIYDSRKNNHYSKKEIKNKKGLFQKQSDNRYQFINYCYEKHRTIEFRFYGGKDATIEGLAKCIILTNRLIYQHMTKTKSFKYSIESEIAREEKYDIVNPLDIASAIPFPSEWQNQSNIDISFVAPVIRERRGIRRNQNIPI